MVSGSKSEYICQSIINTIQQGKWLAGSKLPATTKLASEFGVSYVTLCKALNKLQEDGFLKRRNGVGTFVAEPKVKLKKLGVPLRVQDNPFFTSVYEELSKVCNEYNIEIILGDGAHEMDFIERIALENQNSAGQCAIIRFPSDPLQEPKLQEKIKQLGIKTVILNDWWFHGGDFPCICFDEEEAVCTLLDYFYEKGHRKIALLDDTYSSKRICAHQAFVKWHWKNGFALTPDQELYFWDEQFTEKINALPAKGITAVICLFDLLALRTLPVLKQAGIDVPNDLSIASIDGTRQAVEADITTMRQDVKGMVRKSIDLLLAEEALPEGTIKTVSELFAGGSVLDLTDTDPAKE